MVAGLGRGVIDWRVGDEVCALLAGGGYATKVVVPASQVLPVPDGVDLISAAALPEVTCTVWSNLVMTAGLSARQTVLIHGGSSGIGTMAIQVARQEGATVAVTASRAAGLDACRELGANLAIDYTQQDFVEEIMAATDGRGVDIILDVVGAKYLERNVAALADGGRLIIIGMQGGTTAELNINTLLRKRGRHHRHRPAQPTGVRSGFEGRDRRGRPPPAVADDRGRRHPPGRRLGHRDAGRRSGPSPDVRGWACRQDRVAGALGGHSRDERVKHSRPQQQIGSKQ